LVLHKIEADIASFGDYFADKRISVKSRSAELVTDKDVHPSDAIEPAQSAVEITEQGVPSVSESRSSLSAPPVIPPRVVRSAGDPIKCLV
jgi:nitrite reductase (NAD(P)H)